MEKLNENHFLMAQIRKKITELNRTIQAKICQLKSLNPLREVTLHSPSNEYYLLLLHWGVMFL